MTFEAILKIIRDPSKTDWQKAADLHAGMISDSTHHPIQAIERKTRRIKPAPDAPSSSGVGLI